MYIIFKTVLTKCCFGHIMKAGVYSYEMEK